MTGGSSNRRIAKNTVLLYIRTIIVLFISLYTSRLILKALGAEDLGIYNVVGGIVAMMAFFRHSLSRSTSRFITYELGKKGDSGSLSRIFSSSMTIHLMIAGIAIVLGETIGLYVMENWTDIPESRHQAASWVYQCALVIFSLQILTSPYESIVIAHERMSVFAYMSILSALLKLAIVFILLGNSSDRLILYGVLMVLMDALILIIYYCYSQKKFSAFRFRILWDKELSKRIFAFSGWTLLGSTMNTATQQGVSLLFNNFVGLIANTALGFSNQVNGAITQFVSSFQTAFNPQIIKLYAQKEMHQMHTLMIRASKFSFVLAYMLALPLIFNMNFVLGIWLGEVPKFTVEFCQLILMCSIIDSITGVFNTSITATGNIKGFQIGISCSFLLDIVTSAILLYNEMHPALVFGSRILTRGVLNMIIELFFVRKQLNFSIKNYITRVLIPIFISILISIPLLLFVSSIFNGFARLLTSCLSSVVFCLILTYLLLLDKHEKEMVANQIKKCWLKFLFKKA